jgi:RimJ/RimL family protein N-acetyltransferase
LAGIEHIGTILRSIIYLLRPRRKPSMVSIPPRQFTASTGEPVTIRCAQPEDAANLLTYIRSVAQETGFFVIQPNEFPSAEEQERPWIQDHLDHPGKLALVAEAGGEIIGSLSFENGLFRRTSHTGTFGVSVRRDWRGKGIGTAMLEILPEWTEANPVIDKICLSVFSSNADAIRLYRRLGFLKEGRRAKAIRLAPGEYVDEVLMAKFVKPGLATGSIEIP